MSPYTLLAVLALVIHHTSGQLFGSCTKSQVTKFQQQLSQDCITQLSKTGNSAAVSTINFDVLCQTNCVGRAINFARYNCSDPLLADIMQIGCFQDSGAFGGHCLEVILSDTATEHAVLQSSGSDCIKSGTCSAQCVKDLKEIMTDMGCCFMSFFGNNVLIGELVANKTFTADQQTFFAKLSDATLWSNCGVLPVNSCPDFKKY